MRQFFRFYLFEYHADKSLLFFKSWLKVSFFLILFIVDLGVVIE
jgi:hypothetical protein